MKQVNFQLIRHLGLVNLLILLIGFSNKCIENKATEHINSNHNVHIEDSLIVNNQSRFDTEMNSDTIPILLQRNFVGKEIRFSIEPNLENRMTKVLWESKLNNHEEFVNKVVQVAPNILMYSECPDDISDVLYNTSQPTKIEFLDSSLQTIRIVDIWNHRPFMKEDGVKLTYFHFNAEEMKVLSYEKQISKIIPDEYSLFTNVEVIGNHLILSYKQLSLSGSTIIGMNTSIIIYNPIGEIIAEIDNIPTWDQGVISPNGNYMLYIFGGDLGTVNQPFAKLQRPGWAIMDLKSKNIIYSEYEREGTHLDGAFYRQGLLEVNSTTPFDAQHYDYKVFFEDSTRTIYRKFWLQSEWNELLQEVKRTNIKNWKYYISKYDFEKIIIY